MIPRWLPKTRLGRASGWLAVAAIVFLLVANAIVATGQEGGETFIDNLWIAVPMFAAGIVLLAAGVVAGLAVWKGERSVSIFLIISIASLAAVFIIGEFTVPH